MSKKADADHHSNQSNPNNPANQAAQDNRANQLNPDHEAYGASRELGPPAKEQSQEEGEA